MDIKFFRKKWKLSQYQLALELGRNVEWVRSIEKKEKEMNAIDNEKIISLEYKFRIQKTPLSASKLIKL